MKRRSLSASFGSWCVQLIYNPRRTAGERMGDPHPTSKHTQQKTSEFVLLLPAFLASWVTVGAGAYALSHFVTLSNFSSALALILATAAFISLGAQCFALPWKRLCEASRWPLVVVLILLAVSTRFSNFIPVDEASESNALVAVFLCFITLLSVLLAGAKSGGRIVPLSAPLVPGLSLFGLLCLISVDAEIQFCFLVFLVASIYLLAYTRFLRQIRPDLALGTSARATKPSVMPLRSEVLVWSKQSIVVASVWFLLFLGGGAMLYLPVQRFLPALVTPQLNKMRSAAQGMGMDYHNSTSVMELQGGTYALSDREVMRVTMHQGEPSGLWRGRPYERYNHSRWDEAPERSWRRSPLAYQHPIPWFESRRTSYHPPALKSMDGSIRNVLEEVQPMEESLGVVYASGRVVLPTVGADGNGGVISDEDRNVFLIDGGANRGSYFVRSFVVEPNWGALLSAPGYEQVYADVPHFLSRNLEIPDEPALKMTLRSLVREMDSQTRRPPRTPFAKVRTISNYLIENCTYSLQSPTVPKDQDAVQFFLTESKQGACDMFASSMVMLLRQMKVPARLVTGYLQPEETHTPSGSEPRTFTLRERDAHAWVEYYVPKYGWLAYDPTAGTRTNEDNALPAKIAQLINVPVPNLPAHIFLLPAIGLGLIAIGAAWGRPKSPVATPIDLEEEQLRRFIEARYGRALFRLRRIVPHPAHLTPGEYEARVCRAVLPADVKQEFAALTHLYIMARYGHPDFVSREEIDSCVRRFEAALKHQRKVH